MLGNALEEAKTSKSITSSEAVLLAGTQFTITGFSYEEVDGRYYPVFETSFGTISVRKLNRAVAVKPYEQNGKMVTAIAPVGTFHDKLRAEITKHHGKTNDEVLPLLVDAFKDDTMVVRERQLVTREGKFGDVVATVTHIDIVVK